jgi:hypothetical protein
MPSSARAAGAAATCIDTCVAPFANACSTIADTTAGIVPAEVRQDDPKGPNSTSTPSA